MAAKRVVRLGQEVFFLKDGKVVRTVVAKIEGDGYRFLNGDGAHRQHWFSFEEAASAASDRISARQTALRKELRALARKQRELEAPSYRANVMSAPYRVVDLRDTMALAFARMRRSRNLKKIQVPKTYLGPGHVVYVAITPATQINWETYRPYKYFVLETEVRDVCFSPDGQVHYTFSTPFVVDTFFLSRREVVVWLENYSEPGTREPVPFVSRQQEKEEIAKIPDNIPF